LHDAELREHLVLHAAAQRSQVKCRKRPRTLAPRYGDDEVVDRFLAASFRRIREGLGDVLRGLVAEAQIDPAFRVLFRERFLDGRRAVLRELLARAAPRAPVDIAVDFVFGAMWYRLLDDHAPLDDAFALEVVHALLG
jgi:hypothetical protein